MDAGTAAEAAQAGFNFMSILPWILVGIGGLIALGLVAVAVTRNRDVDPLQERLADYVDATEVKANLEEIEMSVPFTQRVILPLMEQIANFTTQFTPQETLNKTQRLINLAGNPSGITPSILWVMRFAAAIGLGFLLLLVFRITGQKSLFVILGGVGGAVFGFVMPAMWLQSKVTRRQDQIIKTLPDALDLMSICVEAGLGFDQAMSKVHEKWDENELALAFGRVIREIQLGKTRREALRNMADNIDVADITTFTGAIIQADQLGVSISKVLKIQADQMRIKRRQRAQEKAQQAPVKMMIPMVIFIFPTIWMVLLGPAIIQVYRIFFGGGMLGAF